MLAAFGPNADDTNTYLQNRTRLYKGTETQQPDPLNQATEGIANTTAHRALAYVVLENIQLTKDFHNVPPNFEFEVVVTGVSGVNSQEILDSTVNPTWTLGGFFGHMAIDPETGYIWATRSGNGFPGSIYIINPADWSLVREIEGFEYAPYRISYQPRYFYRDFFGFPIEVPAQMWVGGNYPRILGGQVWTVNTHTYEVSGYAPQAGGYGFSPGAVWFDHTSINPLILNEGPGRTLINDQNGFNSFHGLDPGAPTNGIPTTTTTSTTIWPIADGGFRDGFFWGVDMIGHVIKAQRFGTGGGDVPGTPDGDDMGIGTIAIPSGSTGVNPQNRMCYNPDEQCVYTVTGHGGLTVAHVTKLDVNLNQIWQNTYEYIGPTFDDMPITVRFHEGVGDVWLVVWRWTVGLVFQRLNLTDGSVLEEIVTDLPTYAIWDVMLYPGQPYAALTVWGAAYAGVYQTPLFYSPEPEPPTVEDVVRDLSVQAGFDPGELDTSALADEVVDGFVLSDRIAVRRAIEPLQRCYYFDAVESDYIIRFARRGHTALRASIPFSDLAARKLESGDEGKSPPPMARSRAQESELPHHIDIRYMDKDRLYKTTTQYARRLIGHSDRSATINLPIVCGADKAKEVADIALFAAWMARDRAMVVVTRKYLYLDPGDVIEVEDPEDTWTRLIIVKADYNIPGMIQLDCMRDDDSMYGSDLPAVPGPELIQTIKAPVGGRLFLMDIPLLKDQDEGPGLYYTVAGLDAGWTGASVWRTADDGATWDQVSATGTDGQAGYADNQLSFQGGTVE